jgi:hypothetical protein
VADATREAVRFGNEIHPPYVEVPIALQPAKPPVGQAQASARRLERRKRGYLAMGVSTFAGLFAVSRPVVASNLNWKIAFAPMCGTNTNRFDESGTIAWALSAVVMLCTGLSLSRPSAPMRERS